MFVEFIVNMLIIVIIVVVFLGIIAIAEYIYDLHIHRRTIKRFDDYVAMLEKHNTK